MIHLVHFWLKEEYKTPEHKAAFEQALTDLCQCPLADSAKWGRPAPVPPRPSLEDSWDYNIVTYFDSIATHDEYQTDCSIHQNFLSSCKHMWEKAMVIDSELED